jgi:hypothetical protein
MLIEEPVCVLKEVNEGLKSLRKPEGSRLLEEMREVALHIMNIVIYMFCDY